MKDSSLPGQNQHHKDNMDQAVVSRERLIRVASTNNVVVLTHTLERNTKKFNVLAIT